MTDSAAPAEILFVHGALVRDGEWWWHRAAALLEAETAIRSRAVALPSCGEAPGGGGLAEDAAALRRALDESESAIVVAHSYGGTVVAEAGAHPAVARLVYISSYLPDAGTAQAAIMSAEPDPVAVEPAEEGTLRLAGFTEESFAARFLEGADADTRAGAWERVVPQAAAAFLTPTSVEGWRGVDSTYLVCTEDRSTTVALQRAHAARATRAVDLRTGHHPFLTHPELVVAQLRPLLTAD